MKPSHLFPLLIGLAVIHTALAADEPGNTNDLAALPLEKLMDIEVTTSARHPEKVSQTPAAISVITQEDIRRSGATTLPEALRLAPGLDVGRLDASQWAISARGFNDVFANKLLVLQDGRSIYTPLFSGVFWDVQGTMLEDIDRIEVIRGPGATLWGANAVNGIINILTRSAKDTQGTLLSLGGGSEDRGFAGARYGGKINDNVYYRVYGTYYNRDDAALPNGDGASDSWQIGRAGFRLDWDLQPDVDLLTFQGDLYRGAVNQGFGTFDPTSLPTLTRTVQDEFTVDGGNLLGRWSHQFDDRDGLSLQAYYDRTERNTIIFKEQRDTFDVDFQDRIGLGDRNDFLWGAGYRLTQDKIGNSPTISLVPSHRTLHLYSAFAQDELTLIDDRLRLTLGSKLEHNDFTGIEVQPGARLLWTPQEKQTIWASVTRAVRTPSRAEDDVLLNQSAQVAPGIFVPTAIHGDRNFDSEKLIAYELGYRTALHKRITFDLAAFYNVYQDLRSLDADPANPTQLVIGNKLHGDTYGVEVSGTASLFDWWRLRPSYTFLEMDLHRNAGSTDSTSVPLEEGANPQNQFQLRSEMDLPHHLEFDAILRYVDNLPAIHVDSYTTLDLRLGWRPNPHLEIAVGGQNLLQPQHAEFAPSFIATTRAEIERAAYAKLTFRF